jgi:hypothetical protein
MKETYFYLSSGDAHARTKVINGLGRKPAPTQRRQREQPRIVPVRDNPRLDQLGDLTLAHHRVAHIEPAVLPLDGTVDVQRVAQPVVGRAPRLRPALWNRN